MSQVKNRAAADVQITAEHILKVANASGIQKTFKRTEHEITDPEELAMVKLEKRKEFENRVRSNRDRVAVWVKYANWEARLGEFARARSIFERGLQVAHTDRSLWLKYAEMEMEAKFINRARNVWDRAVTILPRVEQFWYKYAFMEEIAGAVDSARKIFDRWMVWEPSQQGWMSYKSGELERARVIYKYALENLPQDQRKKLHEEFISFEKRHALAGREGIDLAVTEKRMARYESAVAKNPMDYDTWFDMARLMESRNDIDKCRSVYDRAVRNVPTVAEKRFWRRYVYLWIYYAVFEELVANDRVRTRAAYIELELSLGEVDRARKLYEKFLEYQPYDSSTWIAYADLEEEIEEFERTQGIYELALQQDQLDDKELIWEKYIEFERKRSHDIATGDRAAGLEPSNDTINTTVPDGQSASVDDRNASMNRVERLYERLLSQTSHIKVWLAYANYMKESLLSDSRDSVHSSDNAVMKVRKLYERGYNTLKEQMQQDARALMLEEWKTFEMNIPNNRDQIHSLDRKMPQRIKKRRLVDEANDIWEEYYEFEFPEDVEQQSNSFANLKFLEMAKKWKSQTAES
eukprot:g927.t1